MLICSNYTVNVQNGEVLDLSLIEHYFVLFICTKIFLFVLIMVNIKNVKF